MKITIKEKIKIIIKRLTKKYVISAGCQQLETGEIVCASHLDIMRYFNLNPRKCILYHSDYDLLGLNKNKLKWFFTKDIK